MFPKIVVLFCVTAYVPFTCSTQDGTCFATLQENQQLSDSIKISADEKLQKGINDQINQELSAHYTYLSMAYYFDQAKHYLPGFSKFFKKMAEEEHEHAQMFMKYLNKRMGKIQLMAIPKPCSDGHWGSGLKAMKHALALENNINQKLLNLHGKVQDIQFHDFLETNFLAEQVESIKEIANYVHILEGLKDNSLGEYQFDKLTLGGSGEASQQFSHAMQI